MHIRNVNSEIETTKHCLMNIDEVIIGGLEAVLSEMHAFFKYNTPKNKGKLAHI